MCFTSHMNHAGHCPPPRVLLHRSWAVGGVGSQPLLPLSAPQVPISAHMADSRCQGPIITGWFTTHPSLLYKSIAICLSVGLPLMRPPPQSATHNHLLTNILLKPGCPTAVLASIKSIRGAYRSPAFATHPPMHLLTGRRRGGPGEG